MKDEKRFWDQYQVLYGLRLSLKKYRSTNEFYLAFKEFYIDNSDLNISYSQFTRYLRGETKLTRKKMDLFQSYLLEEVNLVPDLLIPRIYIDIQAQPIQVDLTELLSTPSTLNFLAYFVCYKENLYNRFDVILTHSEAVPLAIGFSQTLNIPWYTVSYRPPSTRPDQISQYPYLIDQELVSTVYFNQKRPAIRNKRVLIINDYVRKGGLLDILFRVVEDNSGEVSYLLALIGIGSHWKSLFTELHGRLKVLYFLSQ
ncbi:hypothetical protein CEE45_10095 [Candidatus Heimdallarchaeota archaeon B3_Heim]|nr:MAG: hypothetical protein CEE45_10095 [Candidatus Heimdallarchaeota archaeon B3_Heim]